ncbi:MAG: phosphoglucosamine mutase [Clostridiales bacterium]|nr:phosphoglucosamine mutase [Clostridiales bacterium]
MGKYFGTDGVRGEANAQLTPELAFDMGRAAAALLLKQRGAKPEGRAKIAVGRDTRLSGDMLEAAFSAGVCSAGANVLLLGVIPTPGVAVLCRRLRAGFGVVISASHNRFSDNGIKFFSADGDKLPDNLEEEMEALLENKKALPRARGAALGRIEHFPDALSQYAEHLREHLPRSLSGLKIVLDAANGAASALGVELLSGLGAQVIPLFCRPDGLNINDGCGSTHPETLRQTVVQENAHLGLALDGDADRLIAVDEKGQIVDGDQILAVCAAHLQKEGKLEGGKIVATVMSNMGLRRAMEDIGVELLETKVGDRHVLQKMRESGAVLGGEQSGHIIFSRFNSTGDGLATALYLLNVMMESGQPLSELAQIMRKMPQEMLNVPVRSKEDWQKDYSIMEIVWHAERQLAGRGRVLVRLSGTEPLYRVMAEGEDREELRRLTERIAEQIKAKLG